MLRRLQRLIGSFQTQLLALIAATGLAFFVVLQIVDTSIEMQRLRSERLEDSRIVAAVAARALEQGFDQKDFAEMRKVLSAVRNQKHIFHASLVDRELTFMLDELTTTLAPLPLSLQSQVQMRALKSGQTEQAFAPQGIEIAEPLVREGQILGSVTVWTSYPGLLRTSLSVMLPNLLAVLPVMAVALLLSLLLGRRVSAPVKALRQAVQKFADGDFEQKLEIGGFLEFSQLGEALSQLATKLKDNINQIYELAYVDRITQLPNREFFKGEVIRAIKRAERQGSSGALLFVDLDGFKRVNDTMGHEVGDRLLKMFSERVVNVVRANDMVAFGASREYALRGASTDKQIFARLGGDEFTVLLEDIHEETDAASVARRIIAATSEAFVIDGAEVNLGASIGIATYPHDGSDYHSILKSADMAMYQAKEEGKNTYRFYSDELNKHAARRLEVESDLRRALAREELELYFQPIVDCNGGAPVAAEALVRWNHPVKGVLDPGEFIRIAEKSGLVLPLGLWLRPVDHHQHFAQSVRAARFCAESAGNHQRLRHQRQTHRTGNQRGSAGGEPAPYHGAFPPVEEVGHPHRRGRFRNRTLKPGTTRPLAARCRQDRSFLRGIASGCSRRSGTPHHEGDPGPGEKSGIQHLRRRGGDRGAAEIPAGCGLRSCAGLSVRPGNAAGRFPAMAVQPWAG